MGQEGAAPGGSQGAAKAIGNGADDAASGAAVQGVKRSPPRNQLRRAERVAKWNAAGAEGAKAKPRRLTGKRARYDWLDSLYQAKDIGATARHVGMVTALAGDVDGSKIHPGVRTVAQRCALSPRVVSQSLDTLVRVGRLQRQWRAGAAGAGRGFDYLLCVPTVCTQNQHSVLTERAHRACTEDARSEPVCTQGQHSVHPGAVSVDANDTSVCTHGAPTIPDQSIRPAASAPPAQPGELAGPRQAGRGAR